MDLDGFAAEVGSEGPVAPVGGMTQWDVGGAPAADARQVRAPCGVVEYAAAEMVVRCGAGTTVSELDAVLAEHGQMVPLDPSDPARATVGGVLSVGHSGLRRLRYGPVRDTLLEAKFISAEGRLVKAGGPVVKNVTGFDLCRLLVGALGTLGVLAEVVLRCQPRPRASRWFSGPADPFATRGRLFRPSSILWDGTNTWVLLEGHAADVEAEADALGIEFAEVSGPPPIPAGRRSMRPRELHGLAGSPGFLAEIAVGTVHGMDAARRDEVPKVLDQRVKDLFDPTGRLNPGRRVA